MFSPAPKVKCTSNQLSCNATTATFSALGKRSAPTPASNVRAAMDRRFFWSNDCPTVVLADVFGEDYGMTDRCHEDRKEFNGTPRTFGSFFEMAEENAVSRLYLGVHFRMDSDAGLALGYEVGQKVLGLPWK